MRIMNKFHFFIFSLSHFCVRYKRMRPIFYIGFILFMLTSCSEEHLVEPVEQTVVEPVLRPEERPSVLVDGVMSRVNMFKDYEPNRITRAWTPPTSYVLYPDPEKSISVFFAREKKLEETTEAYNEDMEEQFLYMSDGKWRVSKTNLEMMSYYLYGYVPYVYEDNVTATIEKLPGGGKTYEDGAVLTIHNLPSASSNDVCVVVGAKNGKDYYRADADYEVPTLVRGDFEYIGKPTEGDGTGNYVFLLFEHLYSSLDISMRVHSEYNALRTIKLKELHLKTSIGSSPVKNKTNVTITLNKTTDGSSPIAKDGEGNDMIIFDLMGDAEADVNIVPSEPAGGCVLTTNYADNEFLGYFMPEGVTKMDLTSIYDVYDKNVTTEHPEGNLVRANCSATNTLTLNNLYYMQPHAVRGRKYHINLTIRPTYLYMMSDPDLDNPTVTVE